MVCRRDAQGTLDQTLGSCLKALGTDHGIQGRGPHFPHLWPSVGGTLVLGVRIHSVCQREKSQFGRLPPTRERRSHRDGSARLASHLEEPRTGICWEPRSLGREGRCRATPPLLNLELVEQRQATS